MEKKKPYLPPDAILADVCAIQAIASGNANDEQQKRALAWIINEACSTYGLGFYENEREDNFAAGKRFVGHQIIKLIKAPQDAYKNKNTRKGEGK